MACKILLLAALVGPCLSGSAGGRIPVIGYSTPPSNVNNTKDIPETSLKTRTFYQLGLKRFPQGVVTWTELGTSALNYVQIDNNPEHLPKYKPGGDYHQDSLWEFIPVLDNAGQSTGWYGLRNRGRRGALLTWSATDYVVGSKQAFHIILDKNYPAKHKKGDVFLKPVKVQDGGRTYYQLKLLNLPNGVITWTSKGYEDKGSRFIEVDNNSDEGHMMHYKEGGKWYDDTLFTIESPEVQTPEVEGELENDNSGLLVS